MSSNIPRLLGSQWLSQQQSTSSNHAQFGSVHRAARKQFMFCTRTLTKSCLTQALQISVLAPALLTDLAKSLAFSSGQGGLLANSIPAQQTVAF